MATLTEIQLDLLGTIAATQTGSVVFDGETVILDDGTNVEVLGGDFRELVDAGFLRFESGSTYELTGRGRETYEQLTAPAPRPSPPVGFRK